MKMESLCLVQPWTKEENKTFENALAILDEETPNKWLQLAALIPGKSVNDVLKHYLQLVADVNDIEAGLVPIPGFHVPRNKRGRGSCDRNKGVPWTEEEHRRFLLGLEKHGKGDWKNISRNFVVTKSPSQVASHAQKYYLRHMSGGKGRKRRPSIHDLTIQVSSPFLDKPNEVHQQWNHIDDKVFEY